MSKKKVLIFIVTYNAEKTVAAVLARIPRTIFNDPRYATEVLIIDDGSKDSTFFKGLAEKGAFPAPLTVLKNPINLGYGGNQKVGYRYALDNGFDFVALLHGDGQYAPEMLPTLLEPLVSGKERVVFGSRMMEGTKALKGGMPLYKFFGNKILTGIQNWLMNIRLSEWHSGYRLYSLEALSKVPFEKNSNGFDFDTDIIIQLALARIGIHEIPIPTFYGDEICHVNGLQYATKILIACAVAKVQHLGILYEPRFDIEQGPTVYAHKFHFASSHSRALEYIKSGDRIILLGAEGESIATPFRDKGAAVEFSSPEAVAQLGGKDFTKILALDVIEHVDSPEDFLGTIRRDARFRGSALFLTTPNVAFFPVRMMLLLGGFNYGRRGVLDRSHRRLFTLKSLRRVLLQAGYRLDRVRGIPAPYPLAFGERRLSYILLRMNELLCSLWPALFAYQIEVIATPLPTSNQLLSDAQRFSAAEAEKGGVGN